MCDSREPCVAVPFVIERARALEAACLTDFGSERVVRSVQFSGDARSCLGSFRGARVTGA